MNQPSKEKIQAPGVCLIQHNNVYKKVIKYHFIECQYDDIKENVAQKIAQNNNAYVLS